MGNSLLQVFESILQQIGNVLLQELLIGGTGRRLVRAIDGLLDFTSFDKVEHAGKKHGLGFET